MRRLLWALVLGIGFAIWASNVVETQPGFPGVLPSNCTASQIAVAQGSNVWACGSGGSSAAAGSNTQVQFNDGGLFGADAGLTYVKASDALTVSGSFTTALYNSTTNCADSAGAAACGAAPAGSFVLDASSTTVVVSTTAVTANSEIFVVPDMSLGTRLSVTCNTTKPTDIRVTARTAATSFTVTASAPTTNPLCLSYHIIN